MTPERSFVVWHTQRTGSTLLCTTLDRTGIAGHPYEWPDGLLDGIESQGDAIVSRDEVWKRQSTANGVFGVKFGYHQPRIEAFFEAFGRIGFGLQHDRKAIWEAVFPDCRHIMMTRRNKIRLAVSWWKSICGGPGHLSQDGQPLPWQDRVPAPPEHLADSYNFDAIRSLILECVSREAGLQNLFEILDARPMVITYEDFIPSYELTVREALRHISPDVSGCDVPPPLLAQTADEVNDSWERRFRTDLENEAKH